MPNERCAPGHWDLVICWSLGLDHWGLVIGAFAAISDLTLTSSSYNWLIACGTTLTSPTTPMKLVSPFQRGTTCWCRWPGRPAPAQRPMLMPMLKPCGDIADL